MLPGSGFSRALREAAPTLSKRFFSCQTRRPQSLPIRSSQLQSCSRQNPQVKLSSTQLIQSRTTILSQSVRSFSHSRPFREAAIQAETSVKKSTFPESSSNAVAYWLLASAASVFGIVVFGGLTRLTESGLSITEWRPVTGSLPPMSDKDWESEFTKYKSSPEFHLLNSRMSIEEFKSIYWMEWIHRLWARAVGITFILPAAYFIARKQVSKPMMLRIGGIAGLIGFQGFIGWWMVKSGLKDDLFAPGSHPRVSQYRLAAHLGTAFICYTAMVWNGLNILRTNKLLNMSSDKAASTLFSLRNPALKNFKISVAVLAGLVFTTAMSGAFVAGLDAGLIYNEFPYMGLGFTPPKSELFDPFYCRDKENNSNLILHNMFENPSLVQLDHRILATTTFTAVIALFSYARFSQNMKNFLPRAAMKGVHGVLGFAILQVTLGITTLLWLVPISLASAHQAGALALLTWTTVLGSRIWYPTAAARIVQQRMQRAIGQSGRTSGAHEFAAVPKVKPNYGQVDGGALAQASGSAIVAGVAGLLVAQNALNKKESKKVEELEQKKRAYLSHQRGTSSDPSL